MENFFSHVFNLHLSTVRKLQSAPETPFSFFRLIKVLFSETTVLGKKPFFKTGSGFLISFIRCAMLNYKGNLHLAEYELNDNSIIEQHWPAEKWLWRFFYRFSGTWFLKIERTYIAAKVFEEFFICTVVLIANKCDFRWIVLSLLSKTKILNQGVNPILEEKYQTVDFLPTPRTHRLPRQRGLSFSRSIQLRSSVCETILSKLHIFHLPASERRSIESL